MVVQRKAKDATNLLLSSGNLCGVWFWFQKHNLPNSTVLKHGVVSPIQCQTGITSLYLSVPQGCMFPSEFHVTVTKCQIIGSKNVQQITED